VPVKNHAVGDIRMIVSAGSGVLDLSTAMTATVLGMW
jgi:hypothetical protein